MLITYPYRNNLSAYAAGFVGLEGKHAWSGPTSAPRPSTPTWPCCEGGSMRVLMVCTGNICRSTMAHQVLDEAVAAGGLSGAVRVDSAGVSDEEHGNPIDPRAARVLRAHGHGVPDHRARQVRADELADWDLVLAMTSSHYAALSRLRDRARPGGRAPEIRMFRDFDPQCAHLPEGPGRDKDLPDPWYGDYGDFVDTLAVIERSTPALVDYVRP